MSLLDLTEILSIIKTKIKNPKKIVEVGIGPYTEIALSLKKIYPNAQIISADISFSNDKYAELKSQGILVKNDDITKPNMEIYKNADLIYSIRPPIELIPNLVELAKKAKTKLLIRCFTGETPSNEIMKELKRSNTKYSILLTYNLW
ncbi:MAG: UPF0146 family protein [Candidatus Odinarchaeia archaeon]